MIQMRQCSVKIPACARNTCRQETCGRIVRLAPKTCLDMTACRFDLARGKQNGCKKVAEHWLAWGCDQTFFTKPPGLVAPACIEGGYCAADYLSGGLSGHADTLEQRTELATRHSGYAATPEALDTRSALAMSNLQNAIRSAPWRTSVVRV
jgi:hypothetical protein